MSAEKNISEVYEDRNILAMAFLRSVVELSKERRDPSLSTGWYEHDEWAVLFAELPQGQVSWHVRPEDVPEWLTACDQSAFDGHTREEKNQRLLDYAREDVTPVPSLVSFRGEDAYEALQNSTTTWETARHLPTDVEARLVEESEEVETSNGTVTAEPGDVVLRNEDGETYPCSPETFTKSYTVIR